jgi:cysteine desulfurase
MIYLDHNATTPVLPEVLEAMMPYFTEAWGNPSSSYRFSEQPKMAMNAARAKVASLINANPSEVVFTSCATESNNTALHAALASQPEKRHIITSEVEHSSVLAECSAYEKLG